MLVSALFAVIGVGINAQLVASLPRVPLPRPSATALRAVANPNYTPAGTRSGKVLTLAIDVVESAWHPEGENETVVPILGFQERGREVQVPGPLIRVTQGTEVRLTLRNRTDSALTIGGLRPGGSLPADTVFLAPRATREVSYRLEHPGSYFYWGALGKSNWEDRLWLDSQLNGAIVVDPPGASTNDHVFLLSEWFHPYPGVQRPFEVVSVINGKAWPHTQRLELTQGDSTRFRIINTIALFHPMHLHGFYYRVEARGTPGREERLAPAMQPLLNTDLLPPGNSLTFSFLPTTPGNWLLHCHFSFHMDETVTLNGSPRDSAEAAALATAPHAKHPGAEHQMRGLVVGIKVEPSASYRPYAADNAREIRLLVQKQPGRLPGGFTAYGFLIQRGDSVPPRDRVQVPGPVLELTRGQPVRITVVNNLEEPTGVHWHGLEIESFPDGVAGWSGMKDRIMPPVAPGGSFVAEFTPPRSGTFPYHSHLNERHQINSGMYGAIIVTDGPRDPARDHLIVAGGGGPEIVSKIESPFALVNGRRSPPPLRLTAGETHRLRIVSVHPDWRIAFTLRNDSTVARWRAVAKDGHDFPPVQATERPAHVEMGPGETADFEFRAAPGEWRLEVKSAESGWYIPLTVIVTAKAPERPRQ